MSNSLAAAAQWAQMEFGGSQLGDARRSGRLVAVAAAVADRPNGTLPFSFSGWAELKAAYRLLNNPAVSYERIISPHWQRTREACRESGEYLLIEDTTLLDYSSHPKTGGLGWLDQWSQGFLLHSTLAARVEAWDLEQRPELVLLGIFAQNCWIREHPPRKGKESRSQRFQRPRESERWAKAFEAVEAPPARAHWTFIADRDADVYEAFGRCQQKAVDYIIRARSPRALTQADQTVFTKVASAPVLGRMTVDLRSREDAPSRTAILEVRSVQAELRGSWRPGGNLPPLKLNVIQASEIQTPEGAQPIRWALLSSLECERFVQAQRIVTRYSRRWIIEEYHKALKTGARIEASQLETRTGLEALLGVLAVVAVRLLQTKLLARSRPGQVIQEQDFGPEAIAILNARFSAPQEGWTHASLLRALARLGGFVGRKNDGPPGWITIWRGWHRLVTMAEGIRTVANTPTATQKKCG